MSHHVRTHIIIVCVCGVRLGVWVRAGAFLNEASESKAERLVFSTRLAPASPCRVEAGRHVWLQS